jgi:hypothetical protein
MAREKVGHALREEINKTKNQQTTSSASVLPFSVSSTSDSTFDEESGCVSTKEKTNCKKKDDSFKDESSCSTSNSLTSNNSKNSLKSPPQLKVALVSGSSSVNGVSSPSSNARKKRKALELSSSCPLDEIGERDEPQHSQMAWLKSLQESNELFRESDSFLDAEEMIDNCTDSPATTATAATKPGGSINGSSSTISCNNTLNLTPATPLLQWRPPGAYNVEESYMKYLKSLQLLQPAPIKENEHQTTPMACASSAAADGRRTSLMQTTSTPPHPPPQLIWNDNNDNRGSSKGVPAVPMMDFTQNWSQNSAAQQQLSRRNIISAASLTGDRKLDLSFISAAGLSNLVVDDDIFNQ